MSTWLIIIGGFGCLGALALGQIQLAAFFGLLLAISLEGSSGVLNSRGGRFFVSLFFLADLLFLTTLLLASQYIK